MDSSWDNLSDYDYNKDWLFATYLWHRETSYSDNGIEKRIVMKVLEKYGLNL